MSRVCNRLSAIAAIRLFEPMRRHRSRIRNCSQESCTRAAIHRKNEFKPGATTIGIFSCDCTAVRFDNQTHNGEAHSKPFRFRTKKRIEEAVPHLLRNAETVIAHTRANRTVPVWLCRDHDSAFGDGCVSHRVECVDHKIQQDLLKLNWVAVDRWQIWIQRSFQLARM